MPNLSSRPSALTPSREKIAARAYQLWQMRGAPLDEDAVSDWLEAEREIKAGWDPKNHPLTSQPSPAQPT